MTEWPDGDARWRQFQHAMSLCYTALGQGDRASGDHDGFSRLEPASRERAKVAYQKALHHAQEAWAIDPPSPVREVLLANLAELYLLLDQPQQALNCAREADETLTRTTHHPSSPESFARLIVVARQARFRLLPTETP